ncbi:MAG: cobalamin-dependent protein, partial [Candidatus Methylomirabilis sp.]|nr:cobalamin-dependent protein [Deltaproteobacteria bacterium]
MQLTKVFNKTENLGCLHPLGIMYLAGMLRDRQPGKHDLALHDMILRRETADEALPKILAHEPDVVGFSCMTHEASVMHELAKRVKAARPKTKVLVGGPYTDANPEKILQNRAIDFVFVNEAEFTFEEFMRRHEAGDEQPEIEGLAFMRGNEYVYKGVREQSDGAVLDSIPFPAWDLVEVEAYYDAPRFTPSYARREYMSLFTSRGCPYQCTY